MKRKIDVIYLIDGSNEVSPTTFNKIKDFVKASLGYYNITSSEVNVGLIQFGGMAEIVFQPTRGITKDVVARHVTKLSRPGGPRMINKAFAAVRTDLLEKSGRVRPKSRKLIVLVTTGMNSATGADELISEANKLAVQGVSTVALMLGKVSNDAELAKLADRSIVKVDSTDKLPHSFGLLERKIYEAGGRFSVFFMHSLESIISALSENTNIIPAFL